MPRPDAECSPLLAAVRGARCATACERRVARERGASAACVQLPERIPSVSVRPAVLVPKCSI